MTMGSTMRRLKIYYMNNLRATRKALTSIIIVCFLFTIIASKLFGGQDSNERGDVDAIWDKIRALSDTRPMRCRDHAYEFTRLESGADIRVTIATSFHGASEFDDLRLTLTSIVEYTPYDLYTEIVVVDDATDSAEVQRLSGVFLRDPRYNKVKIYRSETHDGPSASRFKGSAIAAGNIVVFVSASTVVTRGWLQPLIAKLIDDQSLVAVPHYDQLLSDDHVVDVDDDRPVLFTWTLGTVEGPVAPDADTISTPVMRGDVLAARKDFLDQIGGFDEHLKQMRGNGYHVELSMRIWQCGGAIRVVTCSRVAVRGLLKQQRVVDHRDFRHIVSLSFDAVHRGLMYRLAGVDQTLNDDESNTLMIRRNYLRHQHAELQCQTFSWYLENVMRNAIVQPSADVERFGKLQSSMSGLCLGSETNEIVADVQLSPCHEHLYERELVIEMTSRGTLQRDGHCLEPLDSGVAFASCLAGSSSQRWMMVDGRLTPATSPRKCLTTVRRDSTAGSVIQVARLEDCRDTTAGRFASNNQQWRFMTM